MWKIMPTVFSAALAGFKICETLTACLMILCAGRRKRQVGCIHGVSARFDWKDIRVRNSQIKRVTGQNREHSR